MSQVVGIDSAKDRVDLVTLVDGKLHTYCSLDTPKDVLVHGRGPSLRWLREHVEEWLDDHHNVLWGKEEPVVFIEENIVLNSGVTTRVLGQTVGMLLALPYRCETVTIQQWKMVAIGNGGASKPQVRAGIVRRMPATDALYGKRQDLFDATGIAIYGDAVLRRR